MALPRNIPIGESSGDNTPKQPSPAKNVSKSPLKQKTQEELEYEQFKKWKAQQESNNNRNNSAEKPPTKKQEEEDSSGLKIKTDPRTGKQYYQIPKTKMNGDLPALEIDLDLDNLNAEADLFLPHLRVPPNKEEMEEIKRRRAELKKIQEREKAAEIEELNATLGVIEEPEKDAFVPPKKKRRFFGKPKGE